MTPDESRPLTWADLNPQQTLEMAINRLRQYMIQRPNVRFDARDKQALAVVLEHLKDLP